jgi:hypothetical protein
MGFKPGNPWRWRPGQSGNPAGRPPGIKAYTPCRRHVHPRTQWRKGQSGNPRGRIPGTGSRQRRTRLLAAMEAGRPYDFDEAVEVLLGKVVLLGTRRKGRPRRPFTWRSAPRQLLLRNLHQQILNRRSHRHRSSCAGCRISSDRPCRAGKAWTSPALGDRATVRMIASRCARSSLYVQRIAGEPINTYRNPY